MNKYKLFSYERINIQILINPPLIKKIVLFWGFDGLRSHSERDVNPVRKAINDIRNFSQRSVPKEPPFNIII